jgi:DNA-binding NarL/FixJ family response regulator
MPKQATEDFSMLPSSSGRGMTTSPAHSSRGLLLVDDHAIVREGLRRVLEPIAGEWHVTEAASAHEALDRLRQQEFALAIVDLAMPGMSGLDLIARIKVGFPAVKILVLSMQAEDQYGMRAFRAGANGYLSKDCAAVELVAAVGKVAAGGTYVSPVLAELFGRQLGEPAGKPLTAALTDRELEVLQRIVAGQRLVNIATSLNLSVKTVSTHKTRIQEKLMLTTTADLIRYGLENDILRGFAGPTGGVL